MVPRCKIYGSDLNFPFSTPSLCLPAPPLLPFPQIIQISTLNLLVSLFISFQQFLQCKWPWLRRQVFLASEIDGYMVVHTKLFCPLGISVSFSGSLFLPWSSCICLFPRPHASSRPLFSPPRPLFLSLLLHKFLFSLQHFVSISLP